MEAINKGAFALALKLEVNKKGTDGKYVPVGSIQMPFPTLADAGISAEQAKDEAGALLFEDGVPVYVSEEANWLQNAILAQVKAQARNKLVSGTATLKEGKTIATNWDELTAEAEGTGNPAALLAIRELKTAFGKWVSSLGKSQAAQTLLNTLFGNKQSLATQTTETKAKMVGYITEFAQTLDADALEKGKRYLDSLLAICETNADAEDF
jgi:hypothetical protein